MITTEAFQDFLDNKIKDQELREDLIKIHKSVLTGEIPKDIDSIVKKVVNKLFNPLEPKKEAEIPFNFLVTNPIGQVIVLALARLEKESYSINEFIELTKSDKKPQGYTYQYISQEIKSGNIKAIKDGGRYVISKMEANKYLKYKGLIK